MLLQSAMEGTGEAVEDSTAKAAGKKGEGSQTGHKTSSLSCFGMPNVVDDEVVVDIVIEVPPPLLWPHCMSTSFPCVLPQLVFRLVPYECSLSLAAGALIGVVRSAKKKEPAFQLGLLRAECHSSECGCFLCNT